MGQTKLWNPTNAVISIDLGFGTYKEAFAFCDNIKDRNWCCSMLDRNGVDLVASQSGTKNNDVLFWFLLVTTLLMFALVVGFLVWKNKSSEAKIRHRETKMYNLPRKKTLEFPDDVSFTSSTTSRELYFSKPKVARKPVAPLTSPPAAKVNEQRLLQSPSEAVLNEQPVMTTSPFEASGIEQPTFASPPTAMVKDQPTSGISKTSTESIPNFTHETLEKENSRVERLDTVPSESDPLKSEPTPFTAALDQIPSEQTHPVSGDHLQIIDNNGIEQNSIQETIKVKPNAIENSQFRASQDIKLPPVERMSNIVVPSLNMDAQQPILMTVIVDYEPRMADELRLKVGDKIILIESYNDGWAMGQHAGSKQMGVFPLVCTIVQPIN